MNRLTLMGRLTTDPDLRSTSSSKSVCQFTLAVDRPFKNADGSREADFVPVVIWGKLGELAAKTVFKGQRLIVEGSIQLRTYEASDGIKRLAAECVASGFYYVEKREGSAFEGEELPFNEEEE